MSIAIDTNVLVRLLVRDDKRQFAAARTLIDRASASGEPVLISLLAIMETEWVLRSRYQLDKTSIAQAFVGLLESADAVVEQEPTLEEALYLWDLHSADFADCLLAARAAQLGCTRFATFDARAARIPVAELIPA